MSFVALLPEEFSAPVGPVLFIANAAVIALILYDYRRERRLDDAAREETRRYSESITRRAQEFARQRYDGTPPDSPPFDANYWTDIIENAPTFWKNTQSVFSKLKKTACNILGSAKYALIFLQAIQQSSE